MSFPLRRPDVALEVEAEVEVEEEVDGRSLVAVEGSLSAAAGCGGGAAAAAAMRSYCRRTLFNTGPCASMSFSRIWEREESTSLISHNGHIIIHTTKHKRHRTRGVPGRTTLIP